MSQDCAQPDEATGGGTSRRTLLRAAGAAAWTVPVVTLATAAPALAASAKVLTVTSFAASYSLPFWTVTAGVSNDSDTHATVNLQVTLTIPQGNNRLDSAPTRIASPGWTSAGPSGSGPWTYVYTRSTQLAAGASTTFSATLLGIGFAASPAVTASVAATATGFAPGSRTASMS